MTEKFNFPKLYTEFAKYYDRLESQYRDYQTEARWLSEILAKHRASDIIDISCGTATHVSLLLENDDLTDQVHRDFVAMDASREMIDVASLKAKTKTKTSQVSFVRGDFLSTPFQRASFDSAICMYWSIAGLDENLVEQLFRETNSILRSGGIFVFDTENAEGIKENLLNVPFIDSFFSADSKEETAVIRANFSSKIAPDLVDWHAYYLLEQGGVSELVNDRMNLQFFSRKQLEGLLQKTGFRTLEVSSAPFGQYEEHSPSLYFVAQRQG